MLVDLLALGFAVATLWLMYHALQQHADDTGASADEPLPDMFADDELLLNEY